MEAVQFSKLEGLVDELDAMPDVDLIRLTLKLLGLTYRRVIPINTLSGALCGTG